MSDLISTNDLSAALRYDVTSDPMSTLAVSGASDVLRSICEQQFDYAEDTVTFYDTGKKYLGRRMR